MTFANRQEFWLGNPNAAGALLAVLVAAVFLFRGRTPLVWGLQILLAGFFFACLLLTASRGAIFGLGLGALATWGLSGFPRPKSVRPAVACLVLVITVALSGSGVMRRLTTLSPSEGSTASRMAIYQCVPSMILAAPWGWGTGRGAEAYGNWFQSPSDTTLFKNLLSTHATWAVEWGWCFLAVYLFAWTAALLICLSHPTAFGILVIWGTCCAFSHVGARWWMWIVPLLTVCLALRECRIRQAWPSGRAWVAALLISATAFLAVLVAGSIIASKPPIHNDGRVVRVGSNAPEFWLLAPDISVVGKTYGKNLRGFSSFAIAERWEDVPSRATVVLTGNAPMPRDIPQCAKLIWLNPPEQLTEKLMQLVERASGTTMMWGALRTDANPIEIRAWFDSLHNGRWRVVKGRGMYLGDVLESIGM